MRWNRIAAGSAVFTFLLSGLSPARASVRREELVYRKKYAMGTVFEIAAYTSSPGQASRAIGGAFKEVVRLDRIMSDYIPDSDLSRINRTAHFRAEPVPRDLYQAIQDSLVYSRLSKGQFDITVGPLSRAWKAEIQGGKAPSLAEEKKLQRCVGWRKVKLIPPNRVEFRSPCMGIDLGAIGKGYAVDKAAAVLRSYGIARALINAGGSTFYAIGSPPGKSAWVVHLRDPSGRLDPEVRLSGNSVSTSQQPRNPQGGSAPFGDIVNPAKGVPVKTPYSVSVVADTATASDALSTTLLLLGPVRGKALVRKLRDVAAIWISPQGRSEMVSTGPKISLDHRDVAKR